jgi:hypothetical protein
MTATADPISALDLDESRGLRPDSHQRRLQTLALLVVAVAVIVAHVTLVGLDRPINWDESIHVSQVNPERPAVFMEPHRTRGVSLLVAPVALFDPSMAVLRAYVVLLAAAGTFAAFRTWIPAVGWAAPIAAALYSTYWVAFFYFAEVLPSHPSAVLAVAAGGLVSRHFIGQPLRYGGWELGAVFALFAMVRPPDAIAVGAGLGLALLFRRQGPAVAGRAAVGGAVGLLPWFLEGMVRFGLGPLGTARSAGEYSVAGEAINKFPLYLASLETQLRCAAPCMEALVERGDVWGLPPPRTTAFLLVASGLALLGFVVARHRIGLLLLPVAGAAPLVAFYSLSGGAMNLRYLIPAYALLLLPPAFGLHTLWRGAAQWWPSKASFLKGGLVVLLGFSAWWQIGLALERFESEGTRHRAAALGQALAEVANGDDCVVSTTVNYPQIQYWSGCLAASSGHPEELQPPLGELGSYVDLAAHAREGSRVFAIGPESPPEASPLSEWDRVTPGGEPIWDRHVYEHRPGTALPEPPCPPDDGAERTLGDLLSDAC